MRCPWSRLKEGLEMTIGKFCRAAAFLLACLATPAWAAAPEEIVAVDPVLDGVSAGPGKIYELETEMVVHNWVLCVSQTLAEDLVRARGEGAEKAVAAYLGFAQAKSCGLFPELRVILRERLSASAGAGYDARAFGALVNLTGDWATAYVVYGGLPEVE
jgi:hypothetical protein